MQIYHVEVDNDKTVRWFDKPNGQLHRVDGPAVEYVNGSKYWYLNGQLHRTDGPALEYASGSKHWYLHGQRHRIDGPAVEYAGGAKAWYLNNNEMTEQEFLAATKTTTDCQGKLVEIDGKKYKLTAIE
jgi:hypothetical protein